MNFVEKSLNCIQCKKTFTFTVKQQEFLRSRATPMILCVVPHAVGLENPKAPRMRTVKDLQSAETTIFDNLSSTGLSMKHILRDEVAERHQQMRLHCT